MKAKIGQNSFPFRSILFRAEGTFQGGGITDNKTKFGIRSRLKMKKYKTKRQCNIKMLIKIQLKIYQNHISGSL